MRILFVDDDASMRSAFALAAPMFAAERGITLGVDTATTHDEALTLLPLNHCAIIVDQWLAAPPHGLAFIYEALERASVDQVIVMLTGYEIGSALQTELFDLGVFPFQKPIEPRILMRHVIDAVLIRRRAQRRATSGVRPATLPEEVEDFRRSRIQSELAKTGGNMSEAARNLGVSPEYVRRNKK